ncbi:MAG: NADH-quinone oxidoreductase subunit J [Deltaproteobacteria bacterium]|nr:NADH-quinone oxidoreductase subunit J [Deltaproteobacteria bacterium]
MGTISQYIRPEVLQYGAFAFILLLTFGGALLAVLHKNIVYNVMGLVTSLLGVAGIFLFLGSPFLAVMEILIYVGAICIAIVFAIMLSQPMHLQIPPRWRPKVVLSFLISVAVFVSFSVIVFKTSWQAAVERGEDWSVARIGVLLLTRYELLFELISLVLLVAILGSIITARGVRSEEEERPEVPGEGGKTA